jgi:hypothetical protein
MRATISIDEVGLNATAFATNQSNSFDSKTNKQRTFYKRSSNVIDCHINRWGVRTKLINK